MSADKPGEKPPDIPAAIQYSERYIGQLTKFQILPGRNAARALLALAARVEDITHYAQCAIEALRCADGDNCVDRRFVAAYQLEQAIAARAAKEVKS